MHSPLLLGTALLYIHTHVRTHSDIMLIYNPVQIFYILTNSVPFFLINFKKKPEQQKNSGGRVHAADWDSIPGILYVPLSASKSIS